MRGEPPWRCRTPGENSRGTPILSPEARYIVVLKGTWWEGSGPKWDKEATTPVPAGSFVIHHPNKIRRHQPGGFAQLLWRTAA
jgi:hypothetical protein